MANDGAGLSLEDFARAEVRRRRTLGETVPSEFQSLGQAQVDPEPVQVQTPAAPTPATQPATPAFSNEYYRELNDLSMRAVGQPIGSLSTEQQVELRNRYIDDRANYAVPGAPDSFSERRSWLRTQVLDPKAFPDQYQALGVPAVPEVPEVPTDRTVQQQIEAADAESGVVDGTVSLGGAVAASGTTAGGDLLSFGLDALDWTSDKLAQGIIRAGRAVGLADDADVARVDRNTETMGGMLTVSSEGVGAISQDRQMEIQTGLQQGARDISAGIRDATETEGDRLRRQVVSEKLQEGDVRGLVEFVKDNPYTVLQGGAEAAGYVLGSGGVVGGTRAVAARVLPRTVTQASTQGGARAAALTAGAKEAAPATSLVGRIVRDTGVVLPSAGAAASGARFEVEQNIRSMTDADVLIMPEYEQTKAMLTDALGEEPTVAQVRDALARRSGRVAFQYGLLAAPLSTLIPGGASVERALLNAFSRSAAAQTTRATATGVIGAGLREGTSEFIEEYTQATGQTAGLRSAYHPDVEGFVPQINNTMRTLASFESDAVAQGVYGAILGTAMGGAFRAARRQQSQDPTTPDGGQQTPNVPEIKPLSSAEARVHADAANSGNAAGVSASYSTAAKLFRERIGADLSPEQATRVAGLVSGIETLGQQQGVEGAQVAQAIHLAVTNYADGIVQAGSRQVELMPAEAGVEYDFALPSGIDPASRAALTALLQSDGDISAAHRFTNQVAAEQVASTHNATLGEIPVFGRHAGHHRWAVDETVAGETLLYSDEDRRVVQLPSGKMISYRKGSDTPITEEQAVTAEDGTTEASEGAALRGVASYLRTARGMDTGATGQQTLTPAPEPAVVPVQPQERMQQSLETDLDPVQQLPSAAAALQTPVDFAEFMIQNGVPEAEIERMGVHSAESGRAKIGKEVELPLTDVITSEAFSPRARLAASTALQTMLYNEAKPEAPKLNVFNQPIERERDPVQRRLRDEAKPDRTRHHPASSEAVEQARMNWLAAEILASRQTGSSVEGLQIHAGFEDALQLADVQSNTIDTPAKAQQNLDQAVTALEVSKSATSPSRTPKRTRGINQIQASQVRSQFEDKWAGKNVRITWYDNEAKVPQRIKGARTGFQALISMDEGGQAEIVMVRDRVSSVAEANKILTHEIVGHYGMRGLIGDEGIMTMYRRLQTQRKTNKSVSAIFSEVEAAYGKLSPDEMAHEVLARAGDLKEDNPGLAAVGGFLRQSLAELGLPVRPKGPVREAVDLFRAAGDLLREGEITTTQATDGTTVLQSRRVPNGVREEGQSQDYVMRGVDGQLHRGQYIKESYWDRIHTAWLDHSGRIEKVQRFVRDDGDGRGRTLTEDQDIASSLKNMTTRAGVVNDFDQQQVVKPFNAAVARAIKKTGRSMDNVIHNLDTYMAAKHAIERNRIFYAMYVPLRDQSARDERMAIMNGVYAGEIGGPEAMRRLMTLADANVEKGASPIDEATANAERQNADDLAAGRITPDEAAARLKSAIEQAKANPDRVSSARARYLASLNLSGISTKDAQATLADFDAKGLTSVMEEIVPYVRAVTERTRQRNTEAGMYGEGGNRVLDMYGFQYYVPLKGRVEDGTMTDDQIRALRTIEWDSGNSTYNGYNQRAQTAGGRETDATKADSPTMVMLSDLNQSARRLSMNEVMARVVNFANAHGDTINAAVADLQPVKFVEDADGARWQLPQRRSTVNNDVFTYMHNGNVTEVSIKDEAFAKALLPLPNSIPKVVNQIGRITRGVGKLITSRNVDFWSTQAMRDIQNALYTVGGEKAPTLAFDTAKAAFSPVNLNLARKFYFASPEAKREMRKKHGDNAFMKSMFERFEAGGHVYFSDAGTPLQLRRQTGKEIRREAGVAPEFWTNSALGRRAPTLANAVGRMVDRGAQGGEKIFEAMDNTASVMDNFMRDATYHALVQSGVKKSEAGRYARQLADFNQQSQAGQYGGIAFLFFQPFLIGTQRATRTLFRGGEVPLSYTPNADGTQNATFDWSKAATSLNWPLLMFHTAKGAAAYMTAAAVMGEDDDGIDNASKLSATTIASNEVWGITNEDGNALRIPRQFGVQMIFEGLGSLAAAYQAGHKSEDEVMGAMTDLMLTNFTPFSPTSRSANDLGSFGATPDQIVRSLSPSLLKPMIEVVTNQNNFGGVVHSNSVPWEYNHDNSFSTTPEMWKDLADTLHEYAGYDLHPESIEHMTRSYLAGFVNPIVKILDNEVRRLDGFEVDTANPFDQTGAVTVLKWSRDVEFHPRSEADRMGRQVEALQREFNTLELQDDAEALQQQFLVDHPYYEDLKDLYISQVGGRNSAARRLSKTIAAIRRENPPDRAEQIQRLLAERNNVYVDFIEQADTLLGR